VERLLHETVVNEQEKRAAQIAALQYQINPHFLYNTLASIRAAALGEQQGGQTAEMLLSLSRYLRNVFRDTAVLVSLESEISNIREYLRIHQLRFRDRLAVEFEIPAEALAAGLPPFLIQPIVENAILHGLSRRLNRVEGGARLLISARTHGAALELEIEDNGEGMPEAQAASVAHEERRPDGVRLHIGLKNINDRIRLKFGPPYGLVIKSKPGAWTRVRLHLPLLPAGESEHA
jgi:two-component system sensor histidine kinase YesM